MAQCLFVLIDSMRLQQSPSTPENCHIGWQMGIDILQACCVTRTIGDYEMAP